AGAAAPLGAQHPTRGINAGENRARRDAQRLCALGAQNRLREPTNAALAVSSETRSDVGLYPTRAPMVCYPSGRGDRENAERRCCNWPHRGLLAGQTLAQLERASNDAADEALEVLAFEASHAQRVIGRRPTHLEHLDVAPRLLRNAQQHEGEVLTRN